MELALELTLGYLAVLVAALAISLVLVALELWRVRTALVPVADALTTVAERTTALDQLAPPLVDVLSRVHLEVGGAADALERGGQVIGIEPPSPPIFQADAAAEWQGR